MNLRGAAGVDADRCQQDRPGRRLLAGQQAFEQRHRLEADLLSRHDDA
jgi:hypothetical protein